VPACEDGTISERLSDQIGPLLEEEQGKAREIVEVLRLKDPPLTLLYWS
jgi:hypothetical protein